MLAQTLNKAKKEHQTKLTKIPNKANYTLLTKDELSTLRNFTRINHLAKGSTTNLTDDQQSEEEDRVFLEEFSQIIIEKMNDLQEILMHLDSQIKNVSDAHHKANEYTGRSTVTLDYFCAAVQHMCAQFDQNCLSQLSLEESLLKLGYYLKEKLCQPIQKYEVEFVKQQSHLEEIQRDFKSLKQLMQTQAMKQQELLVAQDHFFSEEISALKSELTQICNQTNSQSKQMFETLNQQMKTFSQEMVNELKMETFKRITDCESLLETRVTSDVLNSMGITLEKKLRQYVHEQINGQCVRRIENICEDAVRDVREFTSGTKDRINVIKLDIQSIKKCLDTKLSDKALVEINQTYAQTKAELECQFRVHKTMIEVVDDNQNKLHKLVGKLSFELSQRDESLARIPTDCFQKLQEIEESIQTVHLNFDKLQSSIDCKVDQEGLTNALKSKLDKTSFWELIPQGTNANDYMKSLIDENSSELTQKVSNQVLVWDKKLAQLRTDINIVELHKKINLMATQRKVHEMSEKFSLNLTEHSELISKVLSKNKILETKVTDISENFNEIFSRQIEVVAGKRNINCLFCDPAVPPRTQTSQGRLIRGPNTHKGNEPSSKSLKSARVRQEHQVTQSCGSPLSQLKEEQREISDILALSKVTQPSAISKNKCWRKHIPNQQQQHDREDSSRATSLQQSNQGSPNVLDEDLYFGENKSLKQQFVYESNHQKLKEMLNNSMPSLKMVQQKKSDESSCNLQDTTGSPVMSVTHSPRLETIVLSQDCNGQLKSPGARSSLFTKRMVSRTIQGGQLKTLDQNSVD